MTDPLRALVPPPGRGRPPAPDGLAAARAVAARRRARRLGGAGSLALLAVFVAAVGLPGPGEAGRLDVTGSLPANPPAPAGVRSASASPAPAASRLPAPVRTPGSPPLAARRTPTPVPPRSARPSASPPAPPAPPYRDFVYLSYEDQDLDDPCESAQPEAAWCLSADAAPEPSGGWRFALRACRPTGNVTGRLGFEVEDEADFVVRRDGAEVWRWSAGTTPVPDPHDVVVDRWKCALWTTVWPGVDAAGHYVLEATSSAYTLSPEARSASAPFDV